MPLLTLDELEATASLFKSRWGAALGRTLMRMLSVDKVNDLYDRNADLQGQEFTEAVLKDIGVQYELLHEEVLESLPNGPFITIAIIRTGA